MANETQINKSLEDWIVARTQKLQATLITGIRAETPVKTRRAQEGWYDKAIVSKVGETGIIRNEVPYIGWPEFGSDTIAPSAMVRNNLNKVSNK